MRIGALYFHGKLYELENDTIHADFIFRNPELFNISTKEANKIMKSYDCDSLIIDRALQNGAIKIRKYSSDFTEVLIQGRENIDDLVECVIDYPSLFSYTTELNFNSELDDNDYQGSYNIYDIVSNVEELYDI